MKLIILSASLLILTFFSCKKEDKSSSATSAIIGKWTLVKATENDHYSSQDHIDIYGKPGDYFEFSSDGKFKGQLDGDYGESTWIISSDAKKLTIANTSNIIVPPLDVKILTSNMLQLYAKDVSGTDEYTETTLELSK